MIKKLIEKITFKGFRSYVLENQSKQSLQIEKIRDQVFLSNPVMILKDVQIYLPLFYVDHIQKIIYQYQEFYEIATLNYLKNKYKHFDTILDVGANIGNHMLYYCAQLNTQKVVCFEPNPLNRQTLLKNISLNHLENKVTVFDTALGEKSGRGIQKNFSLSNTGTNSIEEIDTVEMSSITIASMDSYDFTSIDFIKIDVEGFEIPVLLGAKNTIRKCRPVIMVEVFENNLSRVNEIMKELSYKQTIILEDHNLIYEPI